jgi:hypothetical protein
VGVKNLEKRNKPFDRTYENDWIRDNVPEKDHSIGEDPVIDLFHCKMSDWARPIDCVLGQQVNNIISIGLYYVKWS